MKYAYIRVSTDQQTNDNQRQEILRHHPDIDQWIEAECSSRKSQDDRGLTELLDRLSPGDTLVVTELSRLARSISELLLLIDGLIARRIGLIAIKQALQIPANGDKMDPTTKTIVTMFGLMAELERDFISIRTRMGLEARRAAGVTLGKPVGTRHPSRLDRWVGVIREGLRQGGSLSALARTCGVSRTALVHFIDTRRGEWGV